MSLITRCPACATTFIVVPDQLRISDGWVRCGRCGEVFDAPVNMFNASDSGVAFLPPSLMPTDSPEPTAEINKSSDALSETVMDAQWWKNQPSLDMSVPVTDATSDSEESNHSTSASTETVVTDGVEARIMTFRATTEECIPEDPVTSSPAFMPGFLKTKAPSALLQPKARIWLMVLAVLTFAALFLQITLHERDLIAVRQPTFKPLLASVCRFAGCEVSEPRQITSITVDGASFSREPSGDGYRLYFSLRNSAAMALKMPAVELTLLDSQERPVLRRVLLPSDFGAPAVLPPHAERTASLSLVLSGVEVATLPPLAGYHVDPFYP